MTMLSIVIPHYNSHKSLIKLLNSIPINGSIQVIVIDDKSDKNKNQLKLLCNHKRFKHITFLTNYTEKKGAGVCRNIGLREAKGKWILFADSDDFFINGFYSKVLTYFNSNYDVVFFKPTSIETDTGRKSDRHIRYERLIKNFINKKSTESEVRLRYQFFVPWSKLIRTDFLHKNSILFDEVIASNDVMFSTKVGHLMKKYTVSQDVIYCVTKSAGTLTTSANLDIFKARLAVHINYCRFLQEKLDHNMKKILSLNGLGLILTTIKNRYGFKRTISTYIELKRNNIKIFDYRFLNPLFVFKNSVHYYRKYINEKKYIQ